MSKPVRAVAIGGGTGLPLVLRALIDLGHEVTAIVTVADDGGSSGSLRRELGVLPPGDARNCLVALAGNQALADVFAYRFERGNGLTGHALGNLIIAALNETEGSFDAALAKAAELLEAQGRVLPSTLERVHLHASDRAGGTVSGQANAARNATALHRVHLEPPLPPAFPGALAAIREADLVVLGPGSLYTSLIPNLLVDGIPEAIRESSATRAYVCNVANQRGETHLMDVADHVEALVDHGLAGAIDVVVAHEGALPTGIVDAEPVCIDADVMARLVPMVPSLHLGDLADPANPLHHDFGALRAALSEVM